MLLCVGACACVHVRVWACALCVVTAATGFVAVEELQEHLLSACHASQGELKELSLLPGAAPNFD